MRFHRTLLYTAILLVLFPIYAKSQQQIRPPIGGTVLFKNARDTAERGSAVAQYNLGMMYYLGTHIPQDLKEAAKWFGKAAKQNYANAQFQLGVMYLQGEGVIQDFDEAAKWFEKAAEQNVPAAQFNLGLMYLQGEGISQDYDEAAKSNNRSPAANAGKAEAGTGPDERKVQNELKTGNATVASPDQYALWAMDSVRESLVSRGEDAKEFRLELAQEPLVRPDCSPLHGKGSNESRRLAAASRLPEAFVPVGIYEEGELAGRAVVVFMNQKPVVQFSGRNSRNSPFSEDVMDGAEFNQVAERLDISQSSERFNAFLPEDIRSLFRHPDRKFRMHMPPGAIDPTWREMLSRETHYSGKGSLDGVDGWRKKLSDEELRRFVALSLDLIFQQVWIVFEGLEGDPGSNLKPALLISNPPEYIKQLEKSVSKNRRLLEAAGVLTPEHFKLTSDYMKQLLGPYTVFKEVAKPQPCPCFLLPYLGDSFVYNRESEAEAMNKIPADAKFNVFRMANLTFTSALWMKIPA